tara:strand:+ start:471 stop:776 length:306 start_codon:yes stop_codon:yes gene_type:complete
MIKTNYKEILPGVLEVDLSEYNNQIIGKVKKDLFSKKRSSWYIEPNFTVLYIHQYYLDKRHDSFLEAGRELANLWVITKSLKEEEETDPWINADMFEDLEY